MLDTQSREPVFEFPLLLFRNLGVFVFSMTPQLNRVVDEYLAKDSGGNMSE